MLSCGTTECNRKVFSIMNKYSKNKRRKSDDEVAAELDKLDPVKGVQLSLQNPCRSKTCPSCLGKYQDTTKKNNKQFCTVKCRSAFSTNPVSERRKRCGCGDYFLDNSPSNNRKHCDYCKKSNIGRRNRNKICRTCKKKFIDTSRGNNMIYCNKDCRGFDLT